MYLRGLVLNSATHFKIESTDRVYDLYTIGAILWRYGS